MRQVIQGTDLPHLRKKDFFHVEEMIKCRAMVLMRVAPYRIN